MSGVDTKKIDDQTDSVDDFSLGEEYLDDERQRKPRGNKLRRMPKVPDFRQS